MLAVAFGLFGLWETYAPWRPLRLGAGRRWAVNATLWVIGALSWRATAGVGAVAVAVLAPGGERRWEWWQLVGTIMLLDLARYGFHRLAHGRLFWRVHQVHHADPELDLTSALRFHPLEMAVENGWVMGWIYVLGLPPQAAAISELVTIGMDIAEHANIRLPVALERVVGLVFVTPETHRTHHSADRRDYGRNFGTVFVVWDRLFGTYAAAPGRVLEFGAPEVSEAESLSVLGLLKAPFRRSS